MPGKTALIADDDEFFRLALRTLLVTRLDFGQVIETASLDDAVERLSDRSDICLALFDLAMPGMETAASLRAVRECFKDLRIAVVSSSQRRRDVLLALESGVHGYVPKSLGLSELAAALSQILEGVIYVPPSLAELPSLSEEVQAATSRHPVPQNQVREALTPRQLDVLELLVQGKSNKEIARALKLGEGTVKVHMAALFRSLHVTSRSAAAVQGARILPSTA